jgi:hypothetical protein
MRAAFDTLSPDASAAPSSGTRPASRARALRLLFALSASALVLSPAFAAGKDKKEKAEDDDSTDMTEGPSRDDFKEKDDPSDDEPAPTRLEQGDSEDDSDPDAKADDDFSDDNGGDDLDFRDESEQETVKAREAGEDTAQIYRDFQKKVSELNTDEEQIKWEQYLEKYPKSLFRDRIETRMDELSNEMFGERIGNEGSSSKDAAKREINFANGWRLMGVDPVSKVSAGFEMGIPNWFGLHGDFEYQVMRQMSAHAGVNHGIGGWEITGGAKYALVKSARTKSILTAALDVGLATKPRNLYPTVAPTLAFGQRFDVLEGLDVAVQVSVIPEFHKPFNLRYTGGLTAELRANEIVYAFTETQFNFRKVESSLFEFNTVSFGLRFVPKKKNNDSGGGRAVVGIGANVPYLHDYWSLYQGAVNADLNYYL